MYNGNYLHGAFSALCAVALNNWLSGEPAGYERLIETGIGFFLAVLSIRLWEKTKSISLDRDLFETR